MTELESVAEFLKDDLPHLRLVEEWSESDIRFFVKWRAFGNGAPYYLDSYLGYAMVSFEVENPECELEVHGGITFYSQYKEGWVYGFDTGHYCDITTPGIPTRYSRPMCEWTLDKMKDECRGLGGELIRYFMENLAEVEVP